MITLGHSELQIIRQLSSHDLPDLVLESLVLLLPAQRCLLDNDVGLRLLGEVLEGWQEQISSFAVSARAQDRGVLFHQLGKTIPGEHFQLLHLSIHHLEPQ